MPDLKSWNLWHGCTKYSEGCKNCYMYMLDKARKVPEKSSIVIKTGYFMKPVKKDRHGRYKLYSPCDGHLLRKDELMQKSYNADRCMTCSSFDTCIGCVDCGACKNMKLVSFEEIERQRQEFNLERRVRRKEQ